MNNKDMVFTKKLKDIVSTLRSRTDRFPDGLQSDAHKFIQYLIDFFQEHYRYMKVGDAFDELFFVEMVSTITCQKCSKCRARELHTNL